MTRTRYRRVEGAPFRAWWMETYGGRAGLLDQWAFFQRGKNSVWIASADVDPRGLDPVDGVGIPFVRMGRRIWKPAGPAVQQFGAAARRNVLEADATETTALLAGGTVDLPPDDPRLPERRRGHAIVRYLGVPVGCALWRGTSLESCVPKGRRLANVDLPCSGEPD